MIAGTLKTCRFKCLSLVENIHTEKLYRQPRAMVTCLSQGFGTEIISDLNVNDCSFLASHFAKAPQGVCQPCSVLVNTVNYCLFISVGKTIYFLL